MSLKKKQQLSKQLSVIHPLFKQEITLGQEILGLMREQEDLLLVGELEMGDQLKIKIQPLLKRLRATQKERKEMVKEVLEQIFSSKNQTLADLLDPTDETNAETLILLEQCQVLVDKITDQKKGNQALYEIVQKEWDSYPFDQALKFHAVYDRKNQQALLGTIDYPEEKSP